MPETRAAPSILIVDDDEDLRAIVQARLQRQGYQVRVAGDAAAAFEAVRAQLPDLLLLDVNLPGLSGYEISRKLKDELFRGLFVPIVFVTGQSELPEKLKGFESGGDDYLVKPFDGEELDARIRSMLKIKGLQDDLRAANERLRSLQDLKDQLSHLLVHDLRVPLSNLLVGAQRLLQKTGHTLSEEETKLWRVVDDSGRLLVEMIDNILDVAAIQEGRLPLSKKRVELGPVLKTCLEQTADAARYRRIHVDASLDGATVEADEKLTRRAVVNLLLNALKASPPDSTVRLRCVLDPKGARIEIEDAGPPIPEEDRSKIFDQYYQAEASKHGRSLSVGYGLVFCRLVAESHGGTLSVEPAPSGNRFVLTLPAKNPAAA